MTKRLTALLVAIACALAVGLRADADPTTLAGRWTERWGLFKRKTTGFELRPTTADVWQAEVASPRKREPRRLTLRRCPSNGWQLTVERRVQAAGLADVIAGTDAGWTWGQPESVALDVADGRLVGGGFRIDLPSDPIAAAPVPSSGPGALGEPSSSSLPVVRVLVTGFDRFPRPVNHPAWHHTPADRRTPSINPSGWAVRNFDPAMIDPSLRSRVRIEVTRLTDVPVEYVVGARAIVDKIHEVDADVAISFGVGADSGADADVETTCTNLMHDGSGFDGEGEGPFQLPASWPPAGDSSTWSEEDRAWLWRYPDNAGVSYNRRKIDPTLPDTLRSTLPVSKIVQRVERDGLSAVDGGGGPGQYICNNVMFKVIDAQTKRGRIGGFVHMASWDEGKRARYTTVLRLAIEESVKAFLARPTN